jgi:predicted phage tail component-like protein
MYKFIDVNEVSEGASLPSEALKFNGEYIENLIEGYRTLSVSGREALTPEIGVHDNGIRDGATLLNRRYPPRIITVRYQLITKTPEAFREAYNNLAMILDVEEAQLIFNDEQDKFFTGTLYEIGEVDAGKNAVTGEFRLYCADPFKYSVEEYEVLASDIVTTDEAGNEYKQKAFVVDYNGTYKAFPTISASFYNETEDGEAGAVLDGDCGYVAFYNEHGNVIQIGDPTEDDGNVFEPSQTLVYHDFRQEGSWSNEVIALWNVAGNSLVTNRNGHINWYEGNEASGYPFGLSATYSTASTSWRGVQMLRQLPADGIGDVGASNFTATFAHHPTFVARNHTLRDTRFGLVIRKADEADRRAFICVSMRTYTTGSVEVDIRVNKPINTSTADYTFSVSNPSGMYTNTIQKNGSTISFNILGKTFEYTNEAIAETKATEIGAFFERYGSGADPVGRLESIRFVKHNCDEFEEIPNKFVVGDVVEAHCRAGKILLNNVNAPSYGSLGNDWEGFYLRRGRNVISTMYSDWVTDEFAPTFKLKYREVFI